MRNVYSGLPDPECTVKEAYTLIQQQSFRKSPEMFLFLKKCQRTRKTDVQNYIWKSGFIYVPSVFCAVNHLFDHLFICCDNKSNKEGIFCIFPFLSTNSVIHNRTS